MWYMKQMLLISLGPLLTMDDLRHTDSFLPRPTSHLTCGSAFLPEETSSAREFSSAHVQSSLKLPRFEQPRNNHIPKKIRVSESITSLLSLMGAILSWRLHSPLWVESQLFIVLMPPLLAHCFPCLASPNHFVSASWACPQINFKWTSYPWWDAGTGSYGLTRAN